MLCIKSSVFPAHIKIRQKSIYWLVLMLEKNNKIPFCIFNWTYKAQFCINWFQKVNKPESVIILILTIKYNIFQSNFSRFIMNEYHIFTALLKHFVVLTSYLIMQYQDDSLFLLITIVIADIKLVTIFCVFFIPRVFICMSICSYVIKIPIVFERQIFHLSFLLFLSYSNILFLTFFRLDI